MQNEGKQRVCQLCLTSGECTYEYIGALTTEILRFLGIGVDLDINGEPVFCRICSDNLQKCFDFKTTCMCTEDCINSFRDDKNNINLGLWEIYLRKNENEDSVLSNCYTVCRLCMEVAEAGCYIPLNEEAKDEMSARTILERYISEIDLDVIKNSVICVSCNDSLYSYFDFVKGCLDMMNKVKKDCITEESRNNPQEKSKSVLQLAAENISNYQNRYADIDMPKNCDENELHDEIKLEFGNMTQGESQQLHDKGYEPEYDSVKVETLKDVFGKHEENGENYKTDLMSENFVGTEADGINIKHEEIDIKSEEEDTVSFRNIPFTSQDVIKQENEDLEMNDAVEIDTSPTYKCDRCTFQTVYADVYNKHHMVIHESQLYIPHGSENYATSTRDEYCFNSVYKCNMCSYKTEFENNMKQHRLKHKHKYKESYKEGSTVGHKRENDNCLYETKYMSTLKKGKALTHSASSEVIACKDKRDLYKRSSSNRAVMQKSPSEGLTNEYENDNYLYETEYKSNLKRRISVHKTPLKIISKCEGANCSYKHKCNVDSSELTLYMCGYTNCFFQTKLKCNLNNHMLVHKNLSELTVYKCEYENCLYSTKWTSNFKLHVLLHKNSSELYKCGYENCLYEANTKDNLKSHLLVHKHPSELIMYKCDYENCLYETKIKGSLKSHLLVHKHPSELIMYKCDYENCLYETKIKGSLKSHLLVHKNPSELTMYKCEYDNCLYEAKAKSRLKQHMLVHEHRSELIKYKCDYENCLYETSLKRYLKSHSLVHKHPSELTMYKCGYQNCLYETKIKRNLKSHLLVHKNRSECTSVNMKIVYTKQNQNPSLNNIS